MRIYSESSIDRSKTRAHNISNCGLHRLERILLISSFHCCSFLEPYVMLISALYNIAPLVFLFSPFAQRQARNNLS
ncbi:uncharacterized protein PHALS_14506 [Plasmopara halstedii]|uniref:Uncharacterized protein n=1 Tax=Plasmopara halstedii TaxID=4781 RepID=A0A0P1A655_PLAHL|nr:uncharacterized protein PHALS_14506 [Plasmopara halstedii]CEG35642.1 hypothetical protein PHALS_14506 [Plasmopara halstedii]|eukprot:XP_024572011.1 hypothetical protein PHALS_14506 [Plasmopara halstedii]